MQHADIRYRELIELTLEGVWVVDSEGQTTYVNDSLCNMLGYSRDELMGNPLFLVMDEEARNEARIKFKNRKEGLVERFDFRYRKKGGGVLWCIVSAKPLYDEAGRFTGSMAMITDITERKLAEMALQHKAAELEHLYERVPACIFKYSVVGQRFQYISDSFEAVTGITVAEVMDNALRYWYLLDSGESSEGALHSVQQALSSFLPYEITLTVTTPQGQLRHLYTVGRPSEENGARFYYGTIMDVTREVTLKKKLSQSERLSSIGQTITGVTHNLKNILIGLRGSMGMLDEQIASGDLRDAAKIWQVFKNGNERLTELVETMLDYTRVEHLQLAPASLPALVREALSHASARPGADRIRFEAKVEDMLPQIRCDNEKLMSAFLNLFANAVDACQPGCEVNVAVRLDYNQPGVFVEVRDNGSGITPEDLKKIFAPFYTTKGRNGTGMGLPLAQKVIHEHGGSLEVSSRPGRTVFTVRLPIAQPDSQIVSPARPTAIEDRGPGVDDLKRAEAV